MVQAGIHAPLGAQISVELILPYNQIKMVSILDLYRLLRIEVFRTVGQIIIAKILFTLNPFFRRIPWSV